MAAARLGMQSMQVATAPGRELGAAGSGAGGSSRVSRARSPPARLNHFVRNFAEKLATMIPIVIKAAMVDIMNNVSFGELVHKSKSNIE